MASVPSFARLTRSLLSFTLVVAAVQGCGSDGPTGGPAVSASEVGTYEKFLDRAAGLSCGAQAACCAPSGYEVNEDCAEDLQKLGFASGLDTRGNYSPEGAAACLSSFSGESVSCNNSPSSVPAPRPYAPDPCRGVFRGPSFGTVPLGGECVLDGDCASAGDNALTKCGVAPGAKIGAPKCYALVSAYPGEPCGEGIGTELGKTFSCLYANTCVDSVCLVLPGEGEACVGGSQCAAGLRCAGVGSKSTCRALAKKGEACSSGGGCEGDLYCDGVVCKARGKAGDACSGDIYGSACELGTYCDGVVCKAYGKVGDVCQSGSTCRSGNCSSKGRCEGLSSGPGSFAPYCK